MRLYLHYQANVTMTTELVSSAVTYLSSFQNNCLTRCFQLSRFASPTHCYCPIIWLSCYLVSTSIVLPLVFVLLVFCLYPRVYYPVFISDAHMESCQMRHNSTISFYFLPTISRFLHVQHQHFRKLATRRGTDELS